MFARAKKQRKKKTRSECHCRHGSQRYGTFLSAPRGVFSLSVLQRWKWRCDAEHGRRSGGGCQGLKKYMITCAFLWVGFLVAVDSTMVNYQKYITVMQLALGVTASNKEHCLPPRKRMWIHPSPTAGSVTAASSVSTSQGKPSLRRIKGRIHRSKSLDSIDLLDSNSAAMEETVIWEQHTVTLHRVGICYPSFTLYNCLC